VAIYERDLILVCSILNYGEGSKALVMAKEAGAMGETILMGKGTVKDKLLNLLGAYEVRKEILIAIAPKTVEDNLYNDLVDKLHLDKPAKGIAFSMPLKNLLRIKDGELKHDRNPKGVEGMTYEAIFAVVNKGQSVDVIEAAESAGSTGGTVIHGRGSGTKEKAKLFNIEIEPEKDIVLILSKKDKSQGIIQAIDKSLQISEPGTGIIFSLDVTRTLGLYEG